MASASTLEPLPSFHAPPAASAADAERSVDPETRATLRRETNRLAISAMQLAVLVDVSLPTLAKVLGGAAVAEHVRRKVDGAIVRMRAATHRGELRIP